MDGWTDRQDFTCSDSLVPVVRGRSVPAFVTILLKQLPGLQRVVSTLLCRAGSCLESANFYLAAVGPKQKSQATNNRLKEAQKTTNDPEEGRGGKTD